jgi:hypothetical protein
MPRSPLCVSFMRSICFGCSFAIASVSAQLSSAQEKVAPEKMTFAAGKLTLTSPSDWKKMPPKSNMIQNEFRFPAEGESFARITFMQAGGSVQQNIDRWIGQFEGTKKEDVKTEKKEVGKSTVHIVDISGTYKESMGGPFAPGPAKKLENHRMLGAIIEHADGAQLFVKSTGPAEVVEKLKEGFLKMLSEQVSQ